MFNLLVSYNGWTSSKGTIDKSRFLNQTNQHLVDQIFPNNIPDLEVLTKIKTLFMPEVGSEVVEPFGRVGTIHNVVDTGKEYAFDIYLDASMPPIPVKQIEKMSRDFGVLGFGLATTHWAVKDSDLFEMLYKLDMNPIPDGHAFKIDNLPVKDRQIALMSPFESRFNTVRDAIFSMASSIGCTCLRADDVWTEDVIIQDIINLIIESKLVICDATGRNANVFYEAGIAHALGKKVILITQNPDDVPFDLRHLRYVQYLGNAQGIDELVSSLKDRVVGLMDS